MNPVTITINAARERYGLGRTKLYELMDDGVIRSVKIGKRRLIIVDAADRYFSSGDHRVPA